MLTIEFETMGCHARVALDGDGSRARRALRWILPWFHARARTLSRFDPGSALFRLNARGSAEAVDEVLWGAIDVALRAASATDGLVTPTILSALEAAGYDRPFDRLEREQPVPPAKPHPVPDWRAIERDALARAILLPPGVRLDLGGTAKGWTADAAVRALAPAGPALVDLGGDIAMSRRRAEPWPVAIADPRGPEEPLALALIREGGIATSGRDVRRWRRSGVEQHHLVDPRTGAPARTDVWTATVIGPSALDAEVAAKRVLIEGSRAGMDWIESHPGLAALVVREDGVVLRTRGVSDRLWRETG